MSNEITIKRAGRPATRQEIDAAVAGDALPPHYLFILCHGILTGRTNSNWTHHFASWVTANDLPIHVNSDHYPAGPFPWWNNVVKNPRLARGVVNIALDTYRAISVSGPPRVVLWGHSNGSNIAALALGGLIEAGIPVYGVLFTGSALHSDIGKNGIKEALDSGMLKKAVAYCSEDDKVVRPLQWLPGAYGSLGTRGWTLDKERVGVRVTGPEPVADQFTLIQRWWPGYQHSDWHLPGNLGLTFATAMRDLSIAEFF